MSFFSGITNAITNPATIAQLAMGPAGWASLAVRTLASAIGQQLIQQLGTKLGLPQSVIDTAQAAFCASCGDTAGARQNVTEAVSGLAEGLNASPAQQGEAERSVNDSVSDLVSRLSESEDFKAAKSSGGKSGGGWLMALASVLGEKLNKMAADVSKLAGEITKDTPDKTAKFGAATQEFGILMNATNNAIKTLGEGLTTTARKG